MLTVKLTRFDTGPEGTFGTFISPSFSYFSVERPDLGNKPSVSCIPPGVYKCTWTYSPRFKKYMYLVEEVEGRSGIRIHPANFAVQLEGCIALGEKVGKIGGKKAILLSRPAIRQFETLMQGKSFTLEIKNA